MGEHVEGRTTTADDPVERGGDPACWAHLVCPGCGAVEAEGHCSDCPYGEARPEPA